MANRFLGSYFGGGGGVCQGSYLMLSSTRFDSFIRSSFEDRLLGMAYLHICL